MATRTEYNECMRPFITGSKPKEERKRDFCIGAKICSGRAQTKEEAAQLCSNTIPKWVRQALPKEDDNLPCLDRMARVHQTIDTVTLGLKTGDIKEVVPACAQLVSDVSKCRPGEVTELADMIATDLKNLSKRPYMKGESKDIQNRLAALKELL